MNCACPHCAGGIENRPDIAGQMIRCPHCGQQFRLPALAVAKAIPVAMPAQAPPSALPIPTPLAVAPLAYSQPQPVIPPPLPPPAPFAAPPRPSASSGASPRDALRKRSNGNTAIILIIAAIIAVPLIGIGGEFAWQQSQVPLVKNQTKRRVETNGNSKTPAVAEAPSKRTTKPSPAKRSLPPVDDEERRLPNGKVDFIANATQAKYDRIRVGMAKEELFTFMGEPPSYKSDYEPDGRVDYYMWGSRGRYGIVFVTIQNGKVLTKSFEGRL